MRIDAHQHFWQFDPVRDSWITDEMKVLQRDFLPHDLQPQLLQQGFDGCVLVQSDQSEAHNDFLLQQAQGNDFIKGIVGWVDLQASNIEERLEHYRQVSLMKGFRHILQGEQDRAFMLQPHFMRGIGFLKKLGFTYDILIFEDQLKYIPQFVQAFPDQKFVIDHLAKPKIKDQQIDTWRKEIKAVAQYPNVWCKVSGMVTETNWQAWDKRDFIPYLDVVVEVFGTDRTLYGSDWPVCLVAASYKQQLGILKDYFASFTQAEQEQVFGGNAVAFYQLK